jgi:hypothetical protein
VSGAVLGDEPQAATPKARSTEVKEMSGLV